MEGDDDHGNGYEVGFGKPPKATRFKKGQSGNPAGKKKGKRSVRTQVEKFFRTPISVTEAGQQRELLPEVVAMKKLFNKVASGDVQAMRLFFTLRREYGGLDPAKFEHAEVDFSEAARLFDRLASASDEAEAG